MSREAIERAGLKLVAVSELASRADASDFAKHAIKEVCSRYGGGFVVYQPDVDEGGLLMIADTEEELIRDALEWIADNMIGGQQMTMF